VVGDAHPPGRGLEQDEGVDPLRGGEPGGRREPVGPFLGDRCGGGGQGARRLGQQRGQDGVDAGGAVLEELVLLVGHGPADGGEGEASAHQAGGDEGGRGPADR
jgi:hypothetical protein